MDLYLQFGYGMLTMSEHLVRQWKSGVVILSPRDLKYEQVIKAGSNIRQLYGSVVFDPQFYLPHADHARLISHSYWPKNYQTAFFNDDSINEMLSTLKDQYNDELRTLFFILPGHYSSEINDNWYNLNTIIINEAIKLNVHKSIYCTLCFSQEVMRSEEQIHQALEFLADWDIDGCYIVPEPPNNNYLINDPVWLINLLDLTAGLKQQGKKVVVGYASHQLLCLSLSKVDAIASGNWLNVRSFNVNKFQAPEETSSRRSLWYYCPQALSEYQIPFLDIGQRLGVLNDLRTDGSFNSNYSNILFSGAQPSTVNFAERDAFCHYLQCLRKQTQDAVKSSYINTREGIKIQLEAASMLTENFNRLGIRGRDRDFSNVVDVNLSAVSVFDRIRGMTQAHNWDS